MEVTREQIELLQKHEVDEHTILEIIKDILGNQSMKLSKMNAQVSSIMVGAVQQKTIKPRKKRATKAEMEARKSATVPTHLQGNYSSKATKPDDFDQAKVDAALADTKRHLGKQKQTDFNPEHFEWREKLD